MTLLHFYKHKPYTLAKKITYKNNVLSKPKQSLQFQIKLVKEIECNNFPCDAEPEQTFFHQG